MHWNCIFVEESAVGEKTTTLSRCEFELFLSINTTHTHTHTHTNAHVAKTLMSRLFEYTALRWALAAQPYASSLMILSVVFVHVHACVCVCARVRVRVCVCACVHARLGNRMPHCEDNTETLFIEWNSERERLKWIGEQNVTRAAQKKAQEQKRVVLKVFVDSCVRYTQYLESWDDLVPDKTCGTWNSAKKTQGDPRKTRFVLRLWAWIRVKDVCVCVCVCVCVLCVCVCVCLQHSLT